MAPELGPKRAAELGPEQTPELEPEQAPEHGTRSGTRTRCCFIPCASFQRRLQPVIYGSESLCVYLQSHDLSPTPAELFYFFPH